MDKEEQKEWHKKLLDTYERDKAILYHQSNGEQELSDVSTYSIGYTSGFVAGQKARPDANMLHEMKQHTAKEIVEMLRELHKKNINFRGASEAFKEAVDAIEAKYNNTPNKPECNCLRAYGHSKTCPMFTPKRTD